LKFEWDAAKAAANLRKHGISFEEAKGCVQGPLAITSDDSSHSETENREKTIGQSDRGRIIIVVHTRRSNGVRRIISARKASRREATDYEKEIRDRLGGKS
jgi:uncharacterized DUF497 family protein